MKQGAQKGCLVGGSSFHDVSGLCMNSLVRWLSGGMQAQSMWHAADGLGLLLWGQLLVTRTPVWKQRGPDQKHSWNKKNRKVAEASRTTPMLSADYCPSQHTPTYIILRFVRRKILTVTNPRMCSCLLYLNLFAFFCFTLCLQHSNYVLLPFMTVFLNNV